MTKGFDVDQEEVCPYCYKVVRFIKPDNLISGDKVFPTYCGTTIDPHTTFTLSISQCPSCHEHLVIKTDYKHRYDITPDLDLSKGAISRVIFPRVMMKKAPPEVPKDIAMDYEKASGVLSISEEASAALSRRCLDRMLGEQSYGGELVDRIEQAKKDLPRIFADTLDGVRQVGDFGAHAIKSKVPGAIAEVGPGEAEYDLEVLELLFDLYYVQRKKGEAIRDRMNKKCDDAGCRS